MDLDQNRFETFEELYVYCYRVAGTVGLMMMPIMGTAPRAHLRGGARARAGARRRAAADEHPPRRGRGPRGSGSTCRRRSSRKFGVTEASLLKGMKTDKYVQLVKWRNR